MNDGEIKARAETLIAQMTPEEKAGQLIHPFYVPGPLGEAIDRGIARGVIGGVAYLMDAASFNRLQRIAMEQSHLKIPLLMAIDVLHGYRTIFPVPIGMAAMWDPGSYEEAQSIAAREARASGVTVAYSPMLDISRDPRWGRMVEGAGEDPYLASKVAIAQVRGLQGETVGRRLIACIKHFAGYGAPLGGRDYGEVDLSESDLWNIYFPPFHAAVKAGAGSVMNAYMALNGVPAAGNAWLLNEVLRKTWGFDGMVISDAKTVTSLTTQHFARDAEDAAARALNSGLDVELAFGPSAMSELPKALASGSISMATLDAAVRRVLLAKLRLGLFEAPYADESAALAIAKDPAHRDVARRVAERAAVLLRNEDNVLPLKKGQHLAVLGPLAASRRDTLGNWVFVANHDETLSVLDGLRAKLGPHAHIAYQPGVLLPPRKFPSPFAKLDPPPPDYDAFDERGEMEKALAAARAADIVILVLGEGQNMSGESASRSTLELPGSQEALLKAAVGTGKPVVLLLMSARPLDLRWAKEYVPAIMQIWHPGTRGGEAVANLLFGDAVPGGKLPYSWPRHVGQVPIIYSQRPSHAPETEGQRYWNEESTPLFPFGYGLSYGTFEFSNLMLDRSVIRIGDTLSVSVDLTNTGRSCADEVAQLYLHQRYGSTSRPARELKGFERVTLAAGETRTLAFMLGAEELRYWSTPARDWVQEPGVFDIWLGGDSRASLHGSFEVTG
ncbi:MAG: beta-glucosidase BglX [Steroidobacteraceae bacterium]